MATVVFRVRSKANKNVSIKVRLLNGKTTDIELNTGFTINPKDWSETTNRPKQNNAVNKQIFSDLKKLESFIFENLNKDLGNGILIDAYWLENTINECFKRVEKTDTGLVTNHIQYIIDNASTRKVKGRKNLGLSKSRINSYVNSKNILAEYQKHLKKQIHFFDINKSFIDKFSNWLIKNKKYSINHSGDQIKNLKAVCLDAEKDNIPVNTYVKNIEVFSESNEDRFIVTLSFAELEQIRTCKEIKTAGLINARNWMLIGCEIGQRGGDLLNITKDNIRYNNGNMYLDLIQQKTNKKVTIGIVNPHIIDIIKNHFPYPISTQKLNVHIKKVCELAEIDEMVEGKKWDEKTKRKKLDFYPKHELVTNHSFRRSFATNYYKKMQTSILIGITGHSKESLFLQYINEREDKDANANLFIKMWEIMNKETEVKDEDKPSQLNVV
ncbi:phage integrase SAM-like domain-containing protein [Flavobacterium sp. 120]|uniref:phage integrase SAM-like domain-containing protein n=1 Tax=Flavobacterium sp. 120 TaxID=2135626 RepID=UPI000EAF72C2|nr:phage integrase SAM-like domain-containing protein [Flavobacterium sp. 120]RKS12853.1 phage integrase family protein [Flavobacterium sp. 120]